MPSPPLSRVIEKLRSFYGKPAPPAATDPFEQILWENVAYLADEGRREQAYRRLQERVGAKPEQILAAPREELIAVAKAGILPADRAEKLRQAAEIALTDFGGDLRPVLRLPLDKAKKALKKFPSIGDPGAEKILLFARSHAVLALDSNGLRALLRLGYGHEEKSYSATYRSVQEAIAGHLKADFDSLIEAHQLLRRHGQELCKRSHPLCEACPLQKECQYYASVRS